MHDSRAFAESGIAARWQKHYQPGGPGMIGDKGYQGTGITTPYKKPPGRELTEARRACNTSLNRLRAAVERAIAHLKCWKVLKTGFRRSLEEFPTVAYGVQVGGLPGVRAMLNAHNLFWEVLYVSTCLFFSVGASR
jgi:hypothetical protein